MSPRQPRSRTALSAAEARRLALAAQGFADPRPIRRPSGWDLRRVLRRVGLLQIDSVNVLERAHYLPAFSRLGPYPRELLDRASQRAPRRLFEYWGHEASLLPVELHPLLRWRMERAADEAWGGMRRIRRERPKLIEELLAQVAECGPVAASELAESEPRRSGPWWDWSDVKRALEWLFWSGQVSSARRRRFERLYDLPERVLPASVLEAPTPPAAEAQRELVRIAARGLGVAAERDLRDYFRLPTAETKLRIAELVEAGELAPVAVEGWGRTAAYLAVGARIPRKIEARALVGPFDSLLWERSRIRRLFGFDYRLEIYVPKPKRRHGYYVLPFLLGDRLVARVDLKADRAANVLLAPAIHLADGAPAETEEQLGAELEAMAAWLGLDRVRSRV
ncbi:MAG: winged helix-turn-helix domain-containing protein [Thermoleophilaceae bacterium]